MIGVFTLISRSHQCSDWPEAERLLGNIKFALISQQNVGHDDNCFGNIFGNIFVDDTVLSLQDMIQIKNEDIYYGEEIYL